MTARWNWFKKLPVLAIALVVLGSWSQVGNAAFVYAVIKGDHTEAIDFLKTGAPGVGGSIWATSGELLGLYETETGTNSWFPPATSFTSSLSVVPTSSELRAGSWSISSNTAANYTFVKFDGLTAIYNHGSRGSFSFNLEEQFYNSTTKELFKNIYDKTGALLVSAGLNVDFPKGINAGAEISNVRAYWEGGSGPPNVPEPLTLGLMASGMACAGFVIRKRRKA